MLRNTFRLFTVSGIEVGIHVSWLIVFALLTFSLATGYFPMAVEGIGTGMSWLLGGVATVLLFGSVLVHELAHSFMARARGLEARSITLFIFGGVSNLGGEARQPSVEFQVAIVGPLTSFAIAAATYLVASALEDPSLRALFGYLALVNALLGGFNLIPGFPLDGGRVLRSIAWKATNSLRRGTDIAAGAGQLIGGLFIFWGIVEIFGGRFFNGVWIAAIGWFLQNAATASRQQVVMETRLERVRVGDVLRLDPSSVSPDSTVAQLVEDHLLPRNRRAAPVCDGSRLVGIVTLGDVGKVPAAERATTRVGDVMSGGDALVTVAPEASLNEAFGKLAEHDFEQVPVVRDGELLGLLTRGDVLRQLQLREALDVEAS
ncbi:MAG TPA: site-2 protease family protein [Candidatus Limnocylindria bacterium]|nr:site-2 protease family protein [Candidatus Limnocylindria bacterium]